MYAKGVSQEPGRSCRLHQKQGAGESEVINPGRHPDLLPGCLERTQRKGGGIRARERGEKGGRKSEHPTVPEKRGNRPHWDPVEGRGCRIMESLEGQMPETLGSESISTRLQRIAKLARTSPEMVITTLAHHIDKEWLREAYRRTRKDGAVGVDEQTAEEYGNELEENLESLLERFKSGRYRAPAVKRVYVPKADGKRKRPIGIPSFEDKVLQRAVAMALEAVYEQDFLDCSYGFRPGKSPHHTLEALWKELMRGDGGCVIEIDIQEFFDTMDRNHLRAFLDKRVRDGVIRRTIGKWLKAGVLENGRLLRSEKGTPQGGVISPLLANIYLHEVLDRWFEEIVKPRMKGKAALFRYADDAVMVFTEENDALRVMEVLPKRLAKFGLTLHPEKTRLVHFRRPEEKRGGGGHPGTFSFLGFTHYWGKTKRKGWAVKRKTASDRLSKSLKAMSSWCRQNRHMKLSCQHRILCTKVTGHYQYYGITGNYRALQQYNHLVRKIWRKWLSRRSNRSRLIWRHFLLLMDDYCLPPPRVVHSVYSRCKSTIRGAGCGNAARPVLGG